MLSEKQMQGLVEDMQEKGLTPSEAIESALSQGHDNPTCMGDSIIITSEHCVLDLLTGCGRTLPLREAEEFRGERYGRVSMD